MASAAISSLPAMMQFGRFELLGRLAVGGMAEIYLARESMVGGARRHVVIKRILPQIATDARFVDMFLAEARLAARLNHPGICHIYEVGEIDGSYFLAMEWVDGVPLSKLIRRARRHGGLPVPIAARIAAEVAGALDHAHRLERDDGQRLGLVHRDVSPQNVMVGFQGSVKLLDFGIAKVRDEGATTTAAGQVKGKFSYMSPEQCLNEAIDGRTDIFALGVCLYECLTAHNLYKRNTQYESMRAVIEEAVPSPRLVRPEIPEELDSIVSRALQKRPEHRFATAGAMREALERWLASEQHVVHGGRIAELMGRLFEDEIKSGPAVDSTAFRESFALVARPSPPPSPSARGAQAGRGRRLLVAALLAAAGATILGGALALGWTIVEGADAPEALGPPLPPLPPLPEIDPEAGEGVPAEPPLESAPRRGTMSVSSTPAGARIEIDGEAIDAVTPVELADLEPGVRRVQLRLPGRPPWDGEVTVVAGDRAVVEHRFPDREPPAARAASGSLSINTRPWSKVYVGGRLLGTTPIGGARVPSGAVRLRLVDRDGNTHHRSVRVEAGAEERVYYDLSGS